MKATIQNISKNINSTTNPQIDIEVIYEDAGFTGDSQFPNGGKRKFIFMLPYEKYSILDEAGLKALIISQGVNLKESFVDASNKTEQEKLDDTQTKETDLSSLIDLEITI